MVRVEPVTQAWAEALVVGDDVFAERSYLGGSRPCLGILTVF